MQMLLLYTLLATTMGTITFLILRRVNRFTVTNALGITLCLILVAIAILSLPRPGDESARFIVLEDSWPKDHRFISALSWGNFGSNAAWLNVVLRAFFAAALPLFGVPFFLMLYQKWVGELASPEQNTAAGRLGILPYMLWAAILIIGLWVWLDISLVTGTIAVAILSAAYPIYRLTLDNAPEDLAHLKPAKENAASDERSYVLQLVESGNVTAEEGAELLNALAATYAAEAARNSEARPSMSKLQKLMVGGLLLAIVGFFLPWLQIDTKEEMRRMAEQSAHLMDAFPGTESLFTNLGDNLPVVTVAGSQTTVGWLTVIALLISAACSFSAIELSEKNRRLIQVVCQVGAGLLLMYILTSSFRHLALGFFVTVAGYALQLLAIKRSWNGRAAY